MAEGEVIPEGRRNSTLLALAGAMRRHGTSQDVIEDALQKENLKRARPPLDEMEVRRIAESVVRYPPEVWFRMLRQDQLRVLMDDDPEVLKVLEEFKGSLVDWLALFADESETEDWLFEPLLPRGRGIATFSEAKAGKSLLTLEVVAAIALGRSAIGSDLKDPEHVLYLDMEMTRADLRERVLDMGYTAADADAMQEYLHYYSLPALPPLDTQVGGQVVRMLAHAHNASLVVVDTMSRVLGGKENDADTLRAFYMHTGSLLKSDGRTLWRLDHAGKDAEKGQRGSSAKNDDVDLIWQLVTIEDKYVTLTATHRRQGWVPAEIKLIRHEEPYLRHERTDYVEPEGTEAALAWMNRMDVPLNLGRNKIREMFREHGISVRNAALSAAIKKRLRDEGKMRVKGTNYVKPVTPQTCPSCGTGEITYVTTPPKCMDCQWELTDDGLTL